MQSSRSVLLLVALVILARFSLFDCHEPDETLATSRGGAGILANSPHVHKFVVCLSFYGWGVAHSDALRSGSAATHFFFLPPTATAGALLVPSC